jgi:hypothetical protein
LFVFVLETKSFSICGVLEIMTVKIPSNPKEETSEWGGISEARYFVLGNCLGTIDVLG